jgi:hypothetical protein
MPSLLVTILVVFFAAVLFGGIAACAVGRSRPTSGGPTRP